MSLTPTKLTRDGPAADTFCFKIFYMVYTGFYLDGFYNAGFGRHLADITDPYQIKRAFRDFWTTNLLSTIGVCLIRLSFAVTLWRLLARSAVRVGIAAIIVVTVCMGGVVAGISVCICWPPKYFWEQALDPWYQAEVRGQDPNALGLKRQGSCLSLGPQLGYTQLSTFIAIDLLLAIVIPFFALRNLKMARQIKLICLSLLSLGAVATVAAACRLAYTFTFADLDILYGGRAVIMWAQIEWATCLIATSCAVLRPLISFAKDPARRESSGSDRKAFFRPRPRGTINEKSSTGDHSDEAVPHEALNVPGANNANVERC